LGEFPAVRCYRFLRRGLFPRPAALVPALCRPLPDDLYINWFYAGEYGTTWNGPAMSGALSATPSARLGWWVSKRKSWLWLLNGSLLGAVLFYIINQHALVSTDAFMQDAGRLWQALTIGHPEYPADHFLLQEHPVRRPDVHRLFSGVMNGSRTPRRNPT